METTPLAERLRPKDFNSFAGQQHLVGKNSSLRLMIESGKIPSMILWGPPGVGKTTLARIISNYAGRRFYTLSAVSSGVKDVREVIAKAKEQNLFTKGSAVLFIDEIHRFSKSQQDSLLGAVEDGTIVLIGATTENPSFEVITPLLSRCQVYILEYLGETELKALAEKAIHDPIIGGSRKIKIREHNALFRFSGGDARKLYNIIELIVNSDSSTKIEITDKLVSEVLQKNISVYDKGGEQHYDVISAFIKTVRGSDPNAAVYWLARMLDGGEDIIFIARRLVVLAAEDIGLANPNALLMANACFDAVHKIGMPEARIILSECTIYLACSPKSNSAYMAIEKAFEKVRNHGSLPVPLHLRNAPTNLMKQIGYGNDYKYPHDFGQHFTMQQYMPDNLKGDILYNPAENPRENEFKVRLKAFWDGNYKY
ncbi:MAG: replication-associated recombination protein A [Bacteroidales bacterium]|nr:replication-associated recombination protein A [Bacteroidales bacterium]HOY39771.1 replication-associated recombination protein A [Bacteroidales bacterium]HQP03867.1 replication-associated recombination protein A [Bacteroidales bacterium]